MICIHCGKRIQISDRKCPYCGCDTESDLRFSYYPGIIPPRKDNDPDNNDQIGETKERFTDAPQPAAYADPVNHSEMRYSEPGKNKGSSEGKDLVSSKHRKTGGFIIASAAVLLTIFLIFMILIHVRQETEPVEPLLSTEDMHLDEVKTQVVETKADPSDQEKGNPVAETEQYYLYFDMNLPDDYPDPDNTVTPDPLLFIVNNPLYLPNVKIEGLEFLGWNTEADGMGDLFQPGEQFPYMSLDTTLYAQWQKPEQFEDGSFI